MTDPMNNAVAIVTGGGTGIGAATVALLASRGVRSVVNYAHSKDAAEAVAAEHSGIAVQADIADDAQCRALAAAALHRFGRIDFLVNNAGRTKHVAHENLDGLDAEDFIDIYRLNTVAAFQMIRACRDGLAASPIASVVNIASVAGVFGIGSSVAYAASKGALITMTQVLRACSRRRSASTRSRPAMSAPNGSKSSLVPKGWHGSTSKSPRAPRSISRRKHPTLPDRSSTCSIPRHARSPARR